VGVKIRKYIIPNIIGFITLPKKNPIFIHKIFKGNSKFSLIIETENNTSAKENKK
jgi:hypothetical protein